MGRISREPIPGFGVGCEKVFPGKTLNVRSRTRMPEIIFHSDVAMEIKASFDWYETQAQGLGDDFINELEAAYQSITERPDTWPKFKNNLHRFLRGKFPFSVIHYPSVSRIFVVAVMRNSRKPGYWIKRS